MADQLQRNPPLGAYRRAIRIRAEPSHVWSEMEDDVHHFRVHLQHAGGVAVAFDGEAVRSPWAVCPGAVEPIRALVGQRLDRIREAGPAERAEQCLHLFDLALLAINHADDSTFEREYRIEAKYDTQPPQISLWRDGEPLLAWVLDNGVVRGSRYHGTKLGRLAARLEGASADEREMVLVLRRASLISAVRRYDLDAVEGSRSFATGASCYAKQPHRREFALRNVGSSRDFWGNRSWPLSS